MQLDVEDALQADNSAVAATYVWPSIPVLLIDWEVGTNSAALDRREAAGTVDAAVALAHFKNSRFLLNAMLADAADTDAPALIHWASFPKPWDPPLTYAQERWRAVASRLEARAGSPPATRG